MATLEQGFTELEPVLQHHGHQAHSLIEVLNRAQQLYGHLSEPLMRHIARQLHLPFSRVQTTAWCAPAPPAMCRERHNSWPSSRLHP